MKREIPEMGFEIAKIVLKVRRKWRNGVGESMRSENKNMAEGEREVKRQPR